MRTNRLVALFFAGFFAKDVIDNIFFLIRNEYPINVFGLQLTASAHKVMFVISLILTFVFLYYGSKDPRLKKQMVSILAGSLIISFLHAVIPNHWLPVVAIGRKEGWSLAETTRITFISGLSHVISTVIIGMLLGLIGQELAGQLDSFTHVIAPVILILMGFYFIRQHYKHRHFHLDKTEIEKKNKRSIITALVVAMFLSPCMEIEAYFLLAGTKGWYMMALIALMYSVITVTGMLVWVRIVYKGLLKLNWHNWEHNAGIITGMTLIVTGIISFFIK